MRYTKVCLGIAVLSAVLGLVALMSSSPAPASAAAADRLTGSHWRFHDGHWCFWDDDDRRWYYTDGAHWFFFDDDAWKLYRFNRHFGRDGFDRDEYRLPRDEDKYEIPRHRYPRRD